MRKLLSLYFLLILASTVHGQQYHAEIHLPKVPKNGFYKIPVTPKIARYLVPGFTNLRILDESNQETPYLIREEIPVRQTEKFQKYEFERHKTKVSTELVLKNPNRKSINNIYLKIRNADVAKEASLLGSDDHANWFAIKQKFNLSPIDGGSGTFEMKVLDFPMSNYLFYSLRISDSLSAPINILTAGYFEADTENGQYEEVPGKVSFSTDLNKKQSFITLSFDTVQFVDRIDLSMRGKQQYFLRRASVEEPRERRVKKGKIEKYLYTLNEFEVSSTHPTQLYVQSRLKEFQIIIDNEDNQPLELTSLRAYQLNRYLITWLSANNDYIIKIGSENLMAPSYDLRFFSDSIPKQIASLPVGGALVYEKKEPLPDTSFFTNKNFIWTAIVLVVLLIGYMAVSLAKDVGKSAEK
ncbi:MAG: hypothetical protein JST48_04270 [Bacteroidetes bacterium]|nr:hypothetical protein [Bacteroidota bacterium]